MCAKISIIFFFLALSGLGEATLSGWRNQWDGPLHFSCPNYKSISRIKSRHDNYREDRIWAFDCRNLPAPTEASHWTEYLNSWDGVLSFSCPYDGVVVGMYSYHDNKKEDRRWKFRCALVKGYKTSKCLHASYANLWDGDMDYTVTHGYFLVGAYSVHDNKKEDRVWKYRHCQLVEK